MFALGQKQSFAPAPAQALLGAKAEMQA